MTPANAVGANDAAVAADTLGAAPITTVDVQPASLVAGAVGTLSVSFATVNRWEAGSSKPQRAQLAKINALAEEASVDPSDAPAAGGAVVTRRRGRQAKPATPTTKPMEQMLWDAACSIRGEKDAPKFKDYLLPLLFLKRLSDVFDDEIARLKLATMGVDIDQLTEEQAKYLASWDEGT